MGFRKIDREALRKLCQNMEITDTEIAERFGVSRNAVSLMIKTMGIQGRGRDLIAVRKVQRARRLDELGRKAMYKKYPAFHEIERRAKQQGLDFELLLDHHKGSHWFRLGSKICYLMKAKAHACLGEDTYSGIRRPSMRRPYDVVVVQLRVGWLVLPADKLPKTSTTCVMGRKKIVPGAYSKRHDYQDHYYADWEWMEKI